MILVQLDPSMKSVNRLNLRFNHHQESHLVDDIGVMYPTVVSTSTVDNWSIEVRPLQKKIFTGHNNPTKQAQLFHSSTSILTIFRKIIDDDVIKLMVKQTNLYALRLKTSASQPHSRIKR